MSKEDIQKAINDKLAYAPQLGAKIKFDLGDDGFIFVDGTQSPPVMNEEDADADTTFVVKTDVLQAIVDGAQDPTMAFMTGKMKVKGSMGYALKLSALLED